MQKSHTDQIFVKYNFGDDEFVAINVRRAQRGRPGTAYKMPMMFEEKLPISVAKKRDLMLLFFSSIHHTWNLLDILWNLPTNKTVRDRLPCADILEDVSESDSNDEF